MKLVIAALALATLVAAPALAQDPQTRAPKARHAQHATPAGSFSQYGRSDTRPHSTNPTHDVYDTVGNYIGSDPDAQVRRDLYRDQSQSNN